MVPLALALRWPVGGRALYLGAYAGGLVFHLSALDWIRTCYSGQGFGGPYAVGWLIAGHLGAVSFLCLVWAGRRFAARVSWPLAVSLPVLWGAFELLRFYFVMLIDQTGFTWLRLGTTLADTSCVVQIADLGGEYLLSMLLAACSGAVVDWGFGIPHGKRGWARWVAPMGVGVLVLSAWGYGHWRLQQPSGADGPVICLMGENELPPLIASERIPTKIVGQADSGPLRPVSWGDGQLVSRRPDLLLWSERAFHHVWLDLPGDRRKGQLAALPADLAGRVQGDYQAYSRHVRRLLEETAARLQIPLAVGCDRVCVRRTTAERYNAFALIGPQQGYQGCYDKRYLVPWAEFLPYDKYWGDRKTFEPHFWHGEAERTFQLRSLAGVFRAGTAICYDLCFAEHFMATMRASRDEPPQFFLQIGSEGQDATGCLQRWMLRMARLRAIETRRAIVRHVAHGYSGVVTSNGKYLACGGTEPIDRPVLLPAVPIDDRTTFYTRWGNWLPVVCLLIVAGVVGLPKRQR